MGGCSIDELFHVDYIKKYCIPILRTINTDKVFEHVCDYIRVFDVENSNQNNFVRLVIIMYLVREILLINNDNINGKFIAKSHNKVVTVHILHEAPMKTYLYENMRMLFQHPIFEQIWGPNFDRQSNLQKYIDILNDNDNDNDRYLRDNDHNEDNGDDDSSDNDDNNND